MRIGNPELCGGGDALGDPRAQDHLQHRRGRRDRALMQATQVMADAFGRADQSGGRHLGGSHRMTLGQVGCGVGHNGRSDS